jgi:hypothetical protein
MCRHILPCLMSFPLTSLCSGQVPCWSTADGLHVSQSNSIIRHLGRTLNLYGSTIAEAAAVDMALVRSGRAHLSMHDLCFSGWSRRLENRLFEARLRGETGGRASCRLHREPQGCHGNQGYVYAHSMKRLIDLCAHRSSRSSI